MQWSDELTLDEARQFAEDQTQRYFGVSVDEFRQHAAEGSLSGDDHPMFVHVAMLTGAVLRNC